MSSNTISIRNNFPKVAAQLDRLGENIGNKAMVRALNATVNTGRTEMARKISKEYRVSVAQAKYRLEIRRASAAKGQLKFEAVLSASRKAKGRSMNVIAFVERSVTLAQARKRMKTGEGGSHALRNGGRSQHALQLRFQIKREGGQKMLPGAFIGNAGRTVFIRTGSKRYPIRAVNTIDVPQMFNARRINSVIVESMLKNFERLFNREVRAVLGGWVK